MILLDTNVLSAIAAEDPQAVSWAHDASDRTFWLSAMSVMEMEAGLHRLPDGRRRDGLRRSLEALLDAWRGRIVPIDESVARLAGTAYATRMNAGRPIGIPDAQIAASALAIGAALATRNTRDFEGLGLALVDPWAA